MVLIVMNLAYMLSAYPFGVLSDRINRHVFLVAGLLVLVASDLTLSYASSVPEIFAGVLLWGLHLGLTQGVLSAMVADSVPARLRGTGFGVFNLTSGVIMFCASFLAGWLWDQYGPEAPFMAGLVFSLLALGVAWAYRSLFFRNHSPS